MVVFPPVRWDSFLVVDTNKSPEQVRAVDLSSRTTYSPLGCVVVGTEDSTLFFKGPDIISLDSCTDKVEHHPIAVDGAAVHTSTGALARDDCIYLMEEYLCSKGVLQIRIIQYSTHSKTFSRIDSIPPNDWVPLREEAFGCACAFQDCVYFIPS
jgi:hypothetical protein